MVIPSLAAAEIEMAKNLLKVTSYTNYKRFAHFILRFLSSTIVATLWFLFLELAGLI